MQLVGSLSLLSSEAVYPQYELIAFKPEVVVILIFPTEASIITNAFVKPLMAGVVPEFEI